VGGIETRGCCAERRQTAHHVAIVQGNLNTLGGSMDQLGGMIISFIYYYSNTS
jgi:hypothetical protein